MKTEKTTTQKTPTPEPTGKKINEHTTLNMHLHDVENIKFSQTHLSDINTYVLRLTINNNEKITFFIKDKTTFKAITSQIKPEYIRGY